MYSRTWKQHKSGRPKTVVDAKEPGNYGKEVAALWGTKQGRKLPNELHHLIDREVMKHQRAPKPKPDHSVVTSRGADIRKASGQKRVPKWSELSNSQQNLQAPPNYDRSYGSRPFTPWNGIGPNPMDTLPYLMPDQNRVHNMPSYLTPDYNPFNFLPYR